MEKLSPTGLLAAAVVLSFMAALGGALLALRLHEPDVIVTQRVVEVSSAERVAEPSEADLASLAVLYSEITGENEDWTFGLVDEIAGMVCEGERSATTIIESGLGPDISMQTDELQQFVDEVLAVCPE